MKKVLLSSAMLLAACTQQPAVSEGWMAIGAVMGNEEIPANGVVQVQYQKSVYNYTVQVNVQPIPGAYFEAWVENIKTGDTLKLGTLQQLFNDVRHGLQYSTSEDVHEYLEVYIVKVDENNPEESIRFGRALLKVVP